jgi:hypothetical protein
VTSKGRRKVTTASVVVSVLGIELQAFRMLVSALPLESSPQPLCWSLELLVLHEASYYLVK